MIQNIEKAQKDVDILNNDPEDDWDYILVPTPQGTHARIDVYDETGEFVGFI